MKKSFLMPFLGASLLGIGGPIGSLKNAPHQVVQAAKSKKTSPKQKNYHFSGTVVIKKKSSKHLSLYSNSLTKVTSHLNNTSYVYVSSVKKVNKKIIAYRYKNNQWIKTNDISRVSNKQKVSKDKVSRLAAGFKPYKETFKVGYTGAYLMTKDGKKTDTIDKGKIVKLIGVGSIKNNRAWELNNGSFIYAKYLVSANTSISTQKLPTISTNSMDSLDPQIVSQLKDSSVPLLSKYSIVKSLSGEQHELAEKLLMDQMGISSTSTSRFDSIMNNISQSATTSLNWIHNS
ncbi:hypothetical protein FP435_03820 [Lactobacillus sp. PV037]|uniref:hypothetical protein n=1 Tax=unclassified Lactobacillus TaxID=2620435 RepID=UPI002240DDE5|nr:MULTISPECIES: hypothetical protein [unclassified Lactobacillus]QNQ82259.1 hypothetical protein FP433_04010 [Lactobacillus sp. PV012]QNQ83630.1 hypothetical protein FP435_03820 [Lactobacillus sp. PV037]